MPNPNPSPATRYGQGPRNNKRGLSGRSKALAALDDMLSEAGNVATLKKAFQAAFDKNPIGFFSMLVMPLIPKEAKLTMNEDGEMVVRWIPIANTPRTQVNGDSMKALPDSGSPVADGDGEKPSPLP